MKELIRITKKIQRKQGIRYGAKSLLNLFSRKAIIVKIQKGIKIVIY